MKKILTAAACAVLAAGCASVPKASHDRGNATGDRPHAGSPQDQLRSIQRDGGEAAQGWSHQAALDAGIKHILETQNPDGSWGGPAPARPMDIYIGGFNSLKAFGNAATGLCLMALAMQQHTPGVDAAFVRGFTWLSEKAPVAGRVRGDTFYNTWAHTYTLEAIARCYNDKRLESIRPKLKARGDDELARLLRLQGLNGGWGYYDFDFKTAVPSGDHSTCFNAAAALAALKAAKTAGFTVPDEGIDRALAFLLSQRRPDGFFIYSDGHKFYPDGYANKPQGSIGRTQSCNFALAEWNKLPKATSVEDGLATFFRLHHFIEIGRQRQFPHEAWYATAPYYYYFGHYYAAMNLAHIRDAGKREAYAAQLASLVAKTQDHDGAFWDYPLYGYTKAYGTGYGVLILSYCKQELGQAAPGGARAEGK